MPQHSGLLGPFESEEENEVVVDTAPDVGREKVVRRRVVQDNSRGVVTTFGTSLMS